MMTKSYVASDVVETFSDSASWEATDAAVAQRAFTSTTATISFLGLVVISLGAIFFGTHHNGGGGGGGGITTVVTVGTSITYGNLQNSSSLLRLILCTEQ